MASIFNSFGILCVMLIPIFSFPTNKAMSFPKLMFFSLQLPPTNLRLLSTNSAAAINFPTLPVMPDIKIFTKSTLIIKKRFYLRKPFFF